MKPLARKQKLSECLNVPKLICTHLMGKEHSYYHHMIVGFILMVVGVKFAHYTADIHIYVVHYAGDLVGYGLHGIGLTPFLEAISRARA